MAVIKFGCFAPNDVLTLFMDLNLAIWYGIGIRTCMQIKIWQILIAIERHTAKPPNLILCQIFRLYGNLIKLTLLVQTY